VCGVVYGLTSHPSLSIISILFLFVCFFLGEDGSEASSAGQMETFLGVKGEEQVTLHFFRDYFDCLLFERKMQLQLQGEQLHALFDCDSG
jgi:hypothetical protein